MRALSHEDHEYRERQIFQRTEVLGVKEEELEIMGIVGIEAECGCQEVVGHVG